MPCYIGTQKGLTLAKDAFFETTDSTWLPCHTLMGSELVELHELMKEHSFAVGWK